MAPATVDEKEWTGTHAPGFGSVELRCLDVF